MHRAVSEVTSLGLALEGTELATFKVNFHYCSALAQHLQWSFLTVPAFQEALAKGGQAKSRDLWQKENPQRRRESVA